MLHWLFVLSISAAIFLLASTLAVWLYGVFAYRAQGNPSTVLARQEDATPLDRILRPLTEQHPDESGLVLLAENADAFAVRVRAAREAGRSLDLMYYIWGDDLTSRILLHEILEAAERGVRVRMLVDDMGVKKRDKTMRIVDSHPLIEIRIFNPTRQRRGLGLRRGLEMLLRFVNVNRRMHNKAWIADGRVAIVGGRNVSDAYYDASSDANFRDLDLMAIGPVVDQVETMFDEFWNSGFALPISRLHLEAPGSDALRQVRSRLAALAKEDQAQKFARYIQETQTLGLMVQEDLHWCPVARLVADPASKAASKQPQNWIMAQLEPVLTSSRQHLRITSPYFVPGEQGRQMIAQLRADGVRVQVLTNSLAATDVAMVHSGYAPYRPSLLKDGVELFELRRKGKRPRLSFVGSRHGGGVSLHSKAFTLDGRQGFVGSLNFDPRSASLNTEMGIVFECPALIAKLDRLYELEIALETSYRVALEPDGALVWHAAEASYRQEPDTSVFRRLLVGIMRWLPLESQL